MTSEGISFSQLLHDLAIKWASVTLFPSVTYKIRATKIILGLVDVALYIARSKPPLRTTELGSSFNVSKAKFDEESWLLCVIAASLSVYFGEISNN